MKQTKSFLAEKCLLYKENFDGIIDGKLIPPIEVAVDPSNACNFNCHWCNAGHVKSDKIIPTDKLITMLKDIADWGVRGICFAGGGEPSIHPGMVEAINACAEVELETAIISNGYTWKDELIEAMVKNMRWIGISVDAGTPETFKNAKGVDGFDKVISNIKKTAKRKKETGSKVGITFKFLIHTLNCHEIYDACRVAKETGADAIHLRPVDFLAFQDKEEQLPVYSIINQAERAKKDFEDNSFSIIPFFANFKEDLKRRMTFSKCRLTPLLGLCTPTGWWACVDRRGHEGLRLCDIDKIRKFWGSKKHLEILDKVNPPKDCGKCTMAKYYPFFNSYKNDEYYWKFS